MEPQMHSKGSGTAIVTDLSAQVAKDVAERSMVEGSTGAMGKARGHSGRPRAGAQGRARKGAPA
jgi:hypothetical protein